MSDQASLARTYYDTARAEILERIRMRETAIFVWLGALGVLSGVAFGNDDPNYRILLILPLLALGFALRITDHEKVIAKLAIYLSLELRAHLGEFKTKDGESLLGWDGSTTLHHRKFQDKIVRVRGDVYYVFIIGPALVAMVLNRSFLLRADWVAMSITVLSAAAIGLSVWFFEGAKRARKEATRETAPPLPKHVAGD